ncbi:hypothetical protein BOX15_Mlig027497g1, partial [Macrostomum lignano]
TMQFCPNDTIGLAPFVSKGIGRCLYDTVTSSAMLGLAVLFGACQLVFYRRYGNRIESNRVNRSCSAGLQYFMPIAMVLLCIARCVCQLQYSPPLHGYQVYYLCANSLAWLLSFVLLWTEAHCLLPSVPTRGHGAILLLMWTQALAWELLSLLSCRSPQWWFRLVKPADQPELLLWAARLFATLLAFGLGLRGRAADIRYGPAPEAEDQTGFLGRQRRRQQQQQSAWFGLGHKLRLMLPYVWPSSSPLLQLRVVACVLLLACGRVINLLVPIYSKYIVDSLTPGAANGAANSSSLARRSAPFYILRLKSEPPLTPSPRGGSTVMLEFRWDLILIFVALKTLQGIGTGSSGLIGVVRFYLWIRVDQFTMREASLKLFNHLHLLSLRWHLSKKTGEVLRIVDRGVNSINQLLSYILFNIAPTLFDISIGIVYLTSWFNAWFGIMVFATMALFLYLSIVITEWRTKFRRRMNALDNERNARAVDSLLNFETVKYYAAEGYETERFRKATVDYQEADYISSQTLNLLNSVQNFIINIGFTGGALLCAYYIVQRANGNPEVPALTVGDYVLFSTYIMQLYVPLNWFATYYRMIQQQFIDMENMFELLDTKAEVADHPDAVDLNLGEATVEFRDVSFHYEPAKPVLKSVTFTVEPGQTVALVGQSGAGKSSILRLLFRFYDVQSGQILIDGKDIRRVTQNSLRQAIGVVPQDTALFNADIRYNIRYGRPDASDAEVEQAATLADIHSRILSFPSGYDTVVGERGLKLSGGEKQRVAIARTLLKGPRIVLLDEATSALDTATERNIQASLDRVCSGRTTLVVAHRLSTIVGADVILVLHDGEIVERGSHDALVQSGGLYAGMWRQQKLESDELAKENETAEM